MSNLLDPLGLQQPTTQPESAPKKRKAATNDGIVNLVRGDQETSVEANNAQAMLASGWVIKN